MSAVYEPVDAAFSSTFPCSFKTANAAAYFTTYPATLDEALCAALITANLATDTAACAATN